MEIRNNEYLYLVATGKLKQKAIELHHKKYCEVGFYTQNEIDPYENDSVYFVAKSQNSEDIVGVTRLIFKKLHDLPTINNFDIFDIEKANLSQLKSNQYAEISAFTKLPEHDVGLGLIKAVYRYSLQNQLSHWICCIDDRVYKYMQRMFKFPFEVIGVPKVYLGSVSIPCAFNLSEGLKNLAEYRKPLYEYFLSAHDIDEQLEVIQ